MKHASNNPLPVVETMLDSRSDEVKTSDERFAAENAVVIPDGGDPCVQASVIGLVWLHNLHVADQPSPAAAPQRRNISVPKQETAAEILAGNIAFFERSMAPRGRPPVVAVRTAGADDISPKGTSPRT